MVDKRAVKKKVSKKKLTKKKVAPRKKVAPKKKTAARKKAPAKAAPKAAPAESVKLATKVSGDRLMLNRSQLAALFGLSPRSIQRLVDDGLPVEVRGAGKAGWQIDGRSAVSWWVHRHVEKEKPDPDAEGGSYSAERLRLTREQANEKEIGNEISRGRLVRIEDIADYQMEAQSLLAASLDGAGSRLANEVHAAESAAECRQIIRTETNRIRTVYAKSLGKYRESVEVDSDRSEPDKTVTN